MNTKKRPLNGAENIANESSYNKTQTSSEDYAAVDEQWWLSVTFPDQASDSER